MSMNTYLKGRLRNTPLPKSHGLLPLFEAVVNSIHAISEQNSDPSYGNITIEILRESQSSLALQLSTGKRGAPPQEPIAGFKISDNGIGFNAKNMESFETLDSDYKAKHGCRGVGRLLWLKAFDRVNIESSFVDENGAPHQRSFSFSATRGVDNTSLKSIEKFSGPRTCIQLDGFNRQYREKSPKSARTIATCLFEHCLYYFVREGGSPHITIKDETEVINLDSIYDEYMFSSSQKEVIKIKDQEFELTHIELKASAAKPHFIAWCAASRVVDEENISSKIPGLHGKIKDESGEFIYACYVTSAFLDQHVRPERIGFDIEELSDDLFSQTEISFSEIRESVLSSSTKRLDRYLKENRKAGRDRVEKFVSQRAPRYRPILERIDEDKLCVDPNISDKELDLILHKQLADIESSLLTEGHEVMNIKPSETPSQYHARLSNYLEKADDIKKSDLASYVFHRKVILDILEKAIQKGENGKYAREELIHELIMPLRKTSTEVKLENCNLWLIDERLAFHDFLASDKTLSSMPITDCRENKEPDICALNIYDEPLLVTDARKLPLASIVIVEIKRPMRNDVAAGEDKDPVEQSLGYLERIRDGGAKTASGRPIPRSDDIPGYCYVICDITPTVERRCKTLGLTVTSDHLGYFGYNPNFKAYIEVISFDRLLNAARERNKAFFDKLGLPTT